MGKYKCSIITFHNVINYGAVLQAFALKKVLGSYCSASIYNHKNILMKRQYSINPFREKGLKKIILSALIFPSKAVQKFNFYRFSRKYLLDNKPTRNETFYITGSDQVWNYDCSYGDKAYFLDFVDDDKLKNSYAASFGFDEVPLEYEDEYKTLLQGFNNISVREKSGQGIVKKLLNRDADIVLDPTFLLTKEEWRKSFCNKKINQKYILVYAFHISDNMRRFLDRLSNEKGLPIIVLMPMPDPRNIDRIDNAIYRCSVSPETWVNYFYNAEYIVTNSFHGAAFSINLNKKFFVELKNDNRNSRITDMLNDFGLNDRYLDISCDLDREIDYDVVNDILEKKREESIRFLEKTVYNYN